MNSDPGFKAAIVRAIDEQANELESSIEQLAIIEGLDMRALATARTQLQTGFMWLRRAVERPAGF